MLSVAVSPLELCGRWSLRRRMHDRRAGLFGQAIGQLVIGTESAGVVWSESGRLSWDGHVADFSRVLRACLIDGEWWMTFSDGRPFHPWRLGVPVEHPCQADRYRGVVAVDPDVQRFRTQWDVTGPAKSQRIITRLSRVSS